MNLYQKKHDWILGGFEFLHVDNVVANAGSGGSTFATDDIAGIHYPRAKVSWGVDGSAVDASATNPLPIVQTGTPALATGASTAAKQPALGTAGAASADVITVQGVASMTALLVNGSAVTQPVSDASGSLTVDSPQLPTTIGQTTMAASMSVALASNQAALPITDNSGSLTIDSPQIPTTLGQKTMAASMAVTMASDQVMNALISANNSTTANLAGAAVFTGTADDVQGYATMSLMIRASHDSAAAGLSIQQSSDGTNWEATDAFSYVAATARLMTFGVVARYMRVVYTNGATLTTTLRISVIYRNGFMKPSSHRIDDVISGESDAELVKAVLTGKSGSSFVNVTCNSQGRLNVTNDAVFAEDAAATAGDSGIQILAVRRDANTTLVGADNDYAPIQVNVDGAVKVAVTAAIPAGTNNIGDVDILSIAAGDNNIGNVDVVTLPNVTLNAETTKVIGTVNIAASQTIAATNAGTFAVQAGQSAHDAAIALNPVRVGLRGMSADYTAVTSGDAADALGSLLGKLVILTDALPANTWTYAAAAGGLVSTVGVTAKAAAGVGIRNYVSKAQIMNSHQTIGSEVVIRDGAAGTVLWRGWAQFTGGGAEVEFKPPLRGTANTLIEIGEVTATATAGVLVNLQGFVAAE